MATTYNAPTPIRHVYKEINVGKYKTTNHYQIDEVTNGKQILSDLLKISLNRQFAKSSPQYWLYTKYSKVWKGLTGLFKTSYSGIYHGDKGQNYIKEDLIIFQLSEDKNTLIVYYYKDYYTKDFERVIKSMKQTL